MLDEGGGSPLGPRHAWLPVARARAGPTLVLRSSGQSSFRARLGRPLWEADRARRERVLRRNSSPSGARLSVGDHLGETSATGRRGVREVRKFGDNLVQ